MKILTKDNVFHGLLIIGIIVMGWNAIISMWPAALALWDLINGIVWKINGLI